jgi:hypothetical protein
MILGYPNLIRIVQCLIKGLKRLCNVFQGKGRKASTFRKKLINDVTL